MDSDHRHSRYVWSENLNYRDLMVELMKNLEPMKFDKDQILLEVEKMRELILELVEEVKKNSAQLYIAGYPCLYLVGCSEVNDTFNELKEVLKTSGVDVIVLDTEIFLKDKILNNEVSLEQMRFKNDGHLSQCGHRVIYEFIRLKMLLANNEQMITQNC